MKKLLKITSITVLIALIFISCAPLYIPNVVNTPMVKEKKDLNASAHIGTSGYDFQGAYAITNSIAVILNTSYLKSDKDSLTDDYHKHLFLETGIGYYKPLGKHFLFDTYCGYGIGKINSYQSVDIFTSYANTYVNRFFVQPSVSFVCPYFEAALTPRTVMAMVSQSTGRQAGFFIEPCIVLKTGLPNVKITTEFGLSYMLNQYDNSFNYQPFIFSIGLQYSLRSVESKGKF